MTLPPETVLIAGGGIAGMTMALTCDQIGVPAVVLESVREIAPLGVGINLQPNAIRELIDLGLGDDLASIGLEAQEWALVGRNGNDVWAEPRGRAAGYDWPQYSVHRGELQMLLYRTVVERMGADAVKTGHRIIGYRSEPDGVVARVDTRDGNEIDVAGSLLLAADGLHSAVRAQMYADQGEPQWGGAVLWRGASMGPPIRTGASFTLVGTLDQRFVHYPISAPDPATGLQLQNWIAELAFDPRDGWRTSDWEHSGSVPTSLACSLDPAVPELRTTSTRRVSWNRQVDIDTFLPHFEDWNFDWLDIPALVRAAPAVWEFPMVDRDPVDHWVEGRACLLGDAAHVMYPVGSNGASQAIVDARVMGSQFLAHGVNPDALLAFQQQLLEPMSALVLRNRGNGPVGILGVVDERCGGVFDDINDVIPRAEIEDFMARYKTAAGFAIEALNGSAPTIAPGSRIDF